MERLKVREKLSYGMGSLGKDFIQGMFTVYLLIFLTDVSVIGAAAAGILLMIARIWDAALNPVIGSVIDRTRTKWGKSRPYILIVPIPFIVFSVLTFTVPGLSTSGRLIWAYVSYILAGTFFTFYDVAIWSMLPALTSDLKERSTLIALARIFTMVGILAVSTLALPIVKTLGGSNTGKGYTLFVAILGVISLIFAWLTFFNTKEKINVAVNKPRFKDQLGALVNNKPLYIVIMGVVIAFFQKGIANAVGVYHLTYYMGAKSLIPIYMLVTNLAIILGMSLTGMLVKKIGNRKASIYALFLNTVFTAVVYFIPPQSTVLMFIIVTLSSLFLGVASVAITGMVAETVDYTEFKTGIRADGVIFSFNSFSIQLGSALASGFAGILLAKFGYVPNSLNQSSTTLMGINLIRSLIPAALCLLSVLAIVFYPINKKDYEEISNELKIKHSASN